jgi:hypothetical protein
MICPRRYFLPHCNQLANLGSSAAFRARQHYPAVVLYMNIVENNHRAYVSALFSIPGGEEHLPSLLPAAWRASPAFAQFQAVNLRKQMLSRPAVVATGCSIAFRRLYMRRHDDGGRDASKAWVTGLREAVGLADGVELIVETDFMRQQVLIMCPDAAAREKIAAILSAQLCAEEERLALRTREWPIPGTAARAVVAVGGVCRELLLRPTQSVCVRFSADSIADRLTEPIAAVATVPEGGFFESLLEPAETCPDDSAVATNLQHFGFQLASAAPAKARWVGCLGMVWYSKGNYGTCSMLAVFSIALHCDEVCALLRF